MKKLLGLLAIAPIAITACTGGSDEIKVVPAKYTVEGVSVGSNTGIMDGLVNGNIDIAGTWGDARRFNGTAEDGNPTVVAVGVEKYRVANDGIQARPGMDAEDIYSIQDLFIEIAAATDITAPIGEAGADEHVLELYGHEAYDPIRDTSREVTYLKQGEPVSKKFIETTPVSGAGELFNATGELKAGETLNIEFIPSTDPTHATTASAALETWLNDNKTADDTAEFNISVAADYNAAATKLEKGTIDLAFLPVNTWAESAPSTEFILQAGRSAQVATLDYDGMRVYQPSTMTNQRLTTTVMNRLSQLYVADVTDTRIAQEEAAEAALAGDGDEYVLAFKAILDNVNDELYNWAVAVNKAATAEELPTVAGSYEAYLWAEETSSIATALQAVYDGNGDSSSYVVDIDGMDLKYGYTSTTSSSTFVFPELWLHRHLDATIELV